MTDPDGDIKILEFSFEPVETKPCGSCLVPTERVVSRQGFEICDSCSALFWVAELLFDCDVTEAEIIPTPALSLRMGALAEQRDANKRGAAARKLVKEYPSVQLVKLLGGFPVVRFRPVVAEVIRYPGSQLAKRIRLKTLTRFADPEKAARSYRDVLTKEKLPSSKWSPGSTSWEYRDFQFIVDIGPKYEIHPGRLDHFSEYPKIPHYSFPTHLAIAGILRGLLGQGQHKNLLFGELLADYGRSTRQSRDKTIMACVLWCIWGKRGEDRNRMSRKGNTIDIVNGLLLDNVEKEPLTTLRNDSAWRDAEKVSDRFDRAQALLGQDSRI